MSAHALLSASGAHRWLACPGSVRLTRDAADTGSAYAEEGTRAHELAELCLTRGWDASNLPGYAEGAAAEDWSRYPTDMREYVQDYLDLVRAQPGELSVELRVDFARWVPGGFGTADAVIVADGTARVVDLKYGRGVRVDADHNPQLQLYALGALEELGWLYQIERWELVICQPRLDHISTWTLTTDALTAWADTVQPIAQAALGEAAPLVPGEKQCRFCAAKATCAARAEANQALARDEFATPCPAPDTLTPDQIGALLPRLGELTRWAKDVQDYALAQAAAGASVPGHKLVAGRSVRQWRDPDAVIKALRKLKYRKADYIEEKLIGIPAVEQLLGGRKRAEPILSPLIARSEGKPALVPAADKRPALAVASARGDFTQAA